jgi:flagellar basal body-associated protein FliL
MAEDRRTKDNADPGRWKSVAVTLGIAVALVAFVGAVIFIYFYSTRGEANFRPHALGHPTLMINF